MALLGRVASFVGFAVLASGLARCSLLQSDAPADQSTVPEAGTPEAGEGGGGTGDGGLPDTSTTTMAQLRIAYIPTNLAQPSVDFCIAPHTPGETVQAPFEPPVLATLFGSSARVPPNWASHYVSIPAGSWDVRVVPSVGPSDAGPGGVSCEVAGPSTGNPVTLGAGTSFTIVVTDLGPTSPLFPLLDEPSSAAGGKIRFFNAAVAGAEYGLGGGIAFTHLATSPTVNEVDVDDCAPNGYCPVSSATGLDIDSTLRVAGQDVASTTNLALSSGSLITAFGVAQVGGQGEGDAGDAGAANGLTYGLVWCDDNAGGTDAWLGSCNVALGPSTSGVRFAAFELGESDAGTDLCVRYRQGSSTLPFLGPALAGSGLPPLPPLGVSPYVALHGGFSYDVELVPAGSTGCLSPIDGTLGSITIPSSNASGSTVVVMGLLAGLVDAGVDSDSGLDAGDAGDASDDAGDAGADSGLDATSPIATTGSITYPVFGDYDPAADDGGGALPAVRVIQAAAELQQPLTVQGNSTTGGGWNVDSVPYGASRTPGNGSVDPRGFGTVPAGTVTLQVTNANPQAATLFFTGSATVAANDYDTFFLYSSGDDAGVGVVQCVDTQGAQAFCQPLVP